MPVLDGYVQWGGDAQEPGVPVQQEPAECGGFVGAVLGVLVCNPALLKVRCRSAEQMRLLNALCLFVEMGGEAGEGRPAQAASA